MDWGLILTVPFITALAAIIAATITDVKVREVPDWVSYGLVVLGSLYALASDLISGIHQIAHPVSLAIGVLLVGILVCVSTISVWRKYTSRIPEAAMAGITVVFLIAAALLITSVLPTISYAMMGLACGYFVGAGLYYTGQWGGGDAKLLMGLGAVMTLPWQWFTKLSLRPEVLFDPTTWSSAPFFLRFLGLLIVCGAAYGMLWMCYLIVKNYASFRKHFARRLEKQKTIRVMVWIAVAVLLVLALLNRDIIGLMLLVLAALIYSSFYLMVAIKIAEQEYMLKTIEAKQLTEGDWVVGGAKIGKEWIVPEKNIGVTKEQIATLTKRSPHAKVVVKEGIPFVPSFLAAFLIATF